MLLCHCADMLIKMSSLINSIELVKRMVDAKIYLKKVNWTNKTLLKLCNVSHWILIFYRGLIIADAVFFPCLLYLHVDFECFHTKHSLLALFLIIQISILLFVVLNGKLGPLRGVSLVAGNMLYFCNKAVFSRVLWNHNQTHWPIKTDKANPCS